MFLQPEQAEHFKLHHWKEHCNAHFILCAATRISDLGPPYPSGLAQRLLKCFDKALGYHTQELTIRQEMADVKGECKAHGHLGAVLMSLANYTNAMKCYQEQLERAKELKVRILKAIVNDVENFKSI